LDACLERWANAMKTRWLLGLVLIVLLVIGAYVGISVSSPPHASSSQTTQTEATSSNATALNSSSTQSTTTTPAGPCVPPSGNQASTASGAFLNLCQVYTGLGYPMVNQLSVPSPDMNLSMALQAVSQSGVLNNGTDFNATIVNYELVVAQFEPPPQGFLPTQPTWDLWFALAYNGYWLSGIYAEADSSAFVSVNAVTGAIVKASGPPIVGTPIPPPGTAFGLTVNESTALQLVRDFAPTQEIPQGLIKNGTVSLIAPIIVFFGPNCYPASPEGQTCYGGFQTPLVSSLSGQERLCWVVEMSSSTPGYGYQGEFAVDAQTGQMDAAWAMENFPSSPG